jgi:hypothetical protein
MIPLKITLTTHHEEKLIPVAGGTRLMAPKATGHEILLNQLHRRPRRKVMTITTGPARKNQRRLP